MSAPEWKDTHFDLLCRIDDVCRSNGIFMILIGDTALNAYRGEGLSDYVAVGIKACETKKFIAAAQKAGLYMKGMFNHYRYGEFGIRVYDPETIDFNVLRAENDDCLGLNVRIDIIGNCPGSELKSRRAAKLKKAFKDYVQIKYNNKWAAPHRRLSLYLAAGRVIPKDSFAKMIFNELIRLYSRDADVVDINSKKYPAAVFDSLRPVEINGRSFNIPADTAAFFTSCFGIGWEDRKCGTFEEGRGIRDSRCSWEEFREFADYLDFDRFYELNSNLPAYSEDYIEENTKVKLHTHLMIRTHLRYILWQMYYPKKDLIIRLHREGRYEELHKELYKYLLVLEKTAKLEMTVCFDSEIFDIAMDVLRHSGHELLADKAEELVPPEHREELRIKDWRGEYI